MAHCCSSAKIEFSFKCLVIFSLRIPLRHFHMVLRQVIGLYWLASVVLFDLGSNVVRPRTNQSGNNSGRSITTFIDIASRGKQQGMLFSQKLEIQSIPRAFQFIDLVSCVHISFAVMPDHSWTLTFL